MGMRAVGRASIAMVVVSILFSLTSGAAGVQAQQEVVWPQLTLVQRYSGFDLPLHLVFVDDGTGRVFVGEHAGRIKVIKNGQVLATPFLDITAQVSCCWEVGMIGLVFPPDFAQKQYFYVYYTDKRNNSVISRFWVSRANPDRADPNSEQIMLFIPQNTGGHKGGQLAFGPDGYLYVGIGDGRLVPLPQVNMNAQDPTNLYGKVLRINSEVGAVRPEQPTRVVSPVEPATRKQFLPLVAMNGAPRYTIPSDNPFASAPEKRGEIWLMGLRNPHRFSFDRQTGDLYISDAGQNRYEEIDFKPAGGAGGQNYGWPILEGNHCYATPTCDPQPYVAPVTEYTHANQQCAVTAGSVYRGPGNPHMRGVFFFADFCAGHIWGLQRVNGVWQTSDILLSASFLITGFAEDLQGSLYVVDWQGGKIFQVNEVSS
jgi:glucose/arabinose dehydrogenase